MMKWVRSMTKTRTGLEQQKKPRLRFVFTWHDFGIFLSLLSFATILCYFLRTIDDSDVYVALRGAGLMKKFMVATFTDLVLRVALAEVLSRTALGTTGIWISWPIGWTIAAALSIVFYATVRWEKLHATV